MVVNWGERGVLENVDKTEDYLRYLDLDKKKIDKKENKYWKEMQNEEVQDIDIVNSLIY